jgi:hypothetical protein
MIFARIFMRTFPVYLQVHGTTDTRVSADESRRMHQSLCAAGGRCELMLIGGDHFIVADALTNESTFVWQLAQ